jgi:hypothetical protein
MGKLILRIQLQCTQGLCSSLAETCKQDANTPALCSVGSGCRTARILNETLVVPVRPAARHYDVNANWITAASFHVPSNSLFTGRSP